MSQSQILEFLLLDIATNEKDPEMLKYLKSKNYRLFQDFQSELEKLQLTSLDTFVVELLLMCDADIFFSWGFSNIHYFLYKCRYIDKSRQRITVSDDKIHRRL